MDADFYADEDWETAIELAPTNTNTNKRLPCVLALDTSGSMAGVRIDDLNAGLRRFEDEFSDENGDPVAIRSVEVAVITFGAGGVQLLDLTTGRAIRDLDKAFVEARNFRAPTLQAGGLTPMGTAIDLALTTIEAREEWYRHNSIPSYRPWLFIITDGRPDDGWQDAARRCLQRDQAKKITVWPIGVQGYAADALDQFSTRPTLPLQGTKFRELFEFISRSLQTASRSAPGQDTVAINVNDLKSWANIDL
jgi:uncharacterized protein YegL